MISVPPDPQMASQDYREFPVVSIILPIRNESRYISRCLEAILAQDYPSGRIEILVVDGMSDDGTRDIVKAFAARDVRVRLFSNPKQIVPSALNLGIRAASGEIVIRVDGHAVIAPDYVRRCVEALRVVNAECVGGPIQTVGDTWMARGIALAQSSRFGVGGAAFRYATTARYVDTLAFGAYRREVFERAGNFDENLVRNQDDEFNFRLIRTGGKIWLDPRIRSTYYSRSTLGALWRQYFEYGLWKVRVIRKHGRSASWRHLAPMVFVLGLSLSMIVSVVTRSFVPAAAILLPYVSMSVVAVFVICLRHGWVHAPVLPIAFVTMHLAYGLGFWTGIARSQFGRWPSEVQPFKPEAGQ